MNPIGLTCGCAGCREAATVSIHHPKYGIRVVCDGHANGYEVVRNVE